MAGSPDVLLLDDGELEDVQETLAELDASYGRIRGGAITPGTPPPRKLLVTTPRRMDAVDLDGADAVVRIVVVEEDSPTLRAHLRAVGFDYLVRRPVHPEALRLLLMRCLYSGNEKRREPRVPVGLEVSFRTGLLPRRATLADLSTRGCRLLSRSALPIGRRISVKIPQHSGAGGALKVEGAVVRMGLDEHLGPDGPYSAAVAFDSALPGDVRNEIEWILEEQGRGPTTLAGETETLPTGKRRRAPRETPVGEPALDPPEIRVETVAHEVRVEVDVQLEANPEKTRERRSGHRGTYPRRVPAFSDRATRVLVARDLSTGGLRVERDSGLALGDRLHLAIYGSADEEPFMVWATAARDDGEAGLLLRFDAVDPAIAARLEQVVANLPAVESLDDDEAHAMGTVVTEILAS